VVADFSATVPLASTRDLAVLWSSEIRPHVLDQIGLISQGVVLGVIREDPTFDPIGNKVEARLVVKIRPATIFFQARLEVADRVEYGLIFKNVWNGNPFARDRYEGPASWVKTVTRSTVTEQNIANPHGVQPNFPGFFEVRFARSGREFDMGLPGEELLLKVYRTTYTFVRADVQNGSSGVRQGAGARLADLGMDLNAPPGPK